MTALRTVTVLVLAVWEAQRCLLLLFDSLLSNPLLTLENCTTSGTLVLSENSCVAPESLHALAFFKMEVGGGCGYLLKLWYGSDSVL